GRRAYPPDARPLVLASHVGLGVVHQALHGRRHRGQLVPSDGLSGRGRPPPHGESVLPLAADRDDPGQPPSSLVCALLRHEALPRAVGDRPATTVGGIRRARRWRDVNRASETAILAGGCFWGMQDLFRRRPGVLSTRAGSSGGDVPYAPYRNP